MDSATRLFAIDLAQQAGSIMRDNFALGMKRTWKWDNSPLTTTDLAINDLVINAVAKKYPDHAVISEEQNDGAAVDAEWTWVCDPVDGTLSFSHGYPMFTFSLGLAHFGESVLGVIYEPMMDRMFVGEKGKGATLNGEPISVSEFDSLQTSVIDLEIVVPDLLDDAIVRKALKDQGALVVSLYSGAFAGSLVACGELAAVVYAHHSPWDGCALDVILNGAGGKMTDLDGKPIRYDKPITGFVAAAAGIHDVILSSIQGGRLEHKHRRRDG